MLPYPFPLQPFLLLLLEVFLPLQTLLLRLLPGFSLSLFFLKHTHRRESNHKILMPAEEEGKKKRNSAKITCLLRNKGVVARCNYCLQPQKGYFPVPFEPKRSIFNIYCLMRTIQSEIQYLKPLHNCIGSCATTDVIPVKDHKGVAKRKCWDVDLSQR